MWICWRPQRSTYCCTRSSLRWSCVPTVLSSVRIELIKDQVFHTLNCCSALNRFANILLIAYLQELSGKCMVTSVYPLHSFYSAFGGALCLVMRRHVPVAPLRNVLLLAGPSLRKISSISWLVNWLVAISPGSECGQWHLTILFLSIYAANSTGTPTQFGAFTCPSSIMPCTRVDVKPHYSFRHCLAQP